MEEIRAAVGCGAPSISARPKHFHSSLSTNSTPRICGTRDYNGGGSCTPASMNGGGTTLTTATASPGTYRYNNGNGMNVGENRGNPNANRQNIGGVRNGLTSLGN